MLSPPLDPMLAKAVPRLPPVGSLPGGTAYEPKYDGYRMLVWARAEGVFLQSRRGTDLTAAFPEIAEAAEALGEEALIDGEAVVYRDGRLDFAALQQRLHRTPRTVARLAREEPAHLIAFDLIQHADALMLTWPYRQRRAALESLFQGHGLEAPWVVTPSTTSRPLAERWLREWPAVGIEGIVAKGLSQPYRPGIRAWQKFRARDTAEAIVGGVTGTLGRPQTLLLGRYTPDGELVLVARSAPVNAGQRAELVPALTSPVGRHPWRDVRFSSSWGSREPLECTLVQPDAVVEFEGDSAVDHGRWRHAVRLSRLRPDLTPDDVPRLPERRSSASAPVDPAA